MARRSLRGLFIGSSAIASVAFGSPVSDDHLRLAQHWATFDSSSPVLAQVPSLEPPAPVEPPANPGPIPPAPAPAPPPKDSRVRDSERDSSASNAIPQLMRSVFVGGLTAPRDLAFAPDGTLFYVERSAGLSLRRTNGTRARLFAPADLVTDGFGGMFGVAVDPKFNANRYVYVFMTSTLSGSRDHRVVRLTIDSAYLGIRERKDIVPGIAAELPPPQKGQKQEPHVGGRLRFGPDGFLYVTIGDLRDPAGPQRRDVLTGKVLRVDRDGGPTPDGEIDANTDSRVFSLGFRQPTGLAFHPATDALFVAEDGAGHDEITQVKQGDNGGWDPRCADPGSATYCGEASTDKLRAVVAMTDLGKHPEAVQPRWTNLNRAQGMAGHEFLRGAQWKAWNGALAVAFASGKRLDVLRVDARGNVLAHMPTLDRLPIALRAVMQGPDGSMYVATEGKPGADEIWRLTPR